MNIQNLDLSMRWYLPAHWYAPQDQMNLKVFIFTSTLNEKIREAIVNKLEGKAVLLEQVSIKVEAGVGVPVIEYCESVLDALLPGVPVSFEFGYTRQILQELIYHIHRSNQFYVNLSN